MLLLVQRVIYGCKAGCMHIAKNACMCKNRKDDGYEFQEKKKKK